MIISVAVEGSVSWEGGLKNELGPESRSRVDVSKE